MYSANVIFFFRTVKEYLNKLKRDNIPEKKKTFNK